MSHAKSTSFTSIALQSLGWPLFWGLSATCAFYLLIGMGVLQSQFVVRYFAGHPVEYIETALFFIGVMALLMKGLDLASQFRLLPRTQLAEPNAAGDDVQRVDEHLGDLMRLPTAARESYLGRRLHRALRHVRQMESADELDQQLRYLSDIEAERAHEDYSLVRMIVWATPMLGFLGTVIGITLALGDLSPEALIDAPKEAMQGLLAGLSIAFDTTALALSLSIVLMFVMYLVREVESQLLVTVDRQAEAQLLGRFQLTGSSQDPVVATVQRMSQEVLKTLENGTQRQAEIWEGSLSASQRQWQSALSTTNETVQQNLETALTSSLNTALESHAQAVRQAEEVASTRVGDSWAQVQRGLSEQSELLTQQYRQLEKQGDVLLRVLNATADVTSLEARLNENLSALAGAKNFEDTVMSLSAAIQLLTTRLGVQANTDLRSQTAKPALREGRAA